MNLDLHNFTTEIIFKVWTIKETSAQANYRGKHSKQLYLVKHMRWGKLTLPEKSPLTAITKYENCVDN